MYKIHTMKSYRSGILQRSDQIMQCERFAEEAKPARKNTYIYMINLKECNGQLLTLKFG